jgi:two-component system, OmpR family, phosphate regulon response regulator PhoB
VRVLVVDDDEPIRTVVRFGLDAEVLEAADGPSALRLLDEQPVDVVVLDLMLPQMSGLEVLKRIRAAKGCKDVPVIMLTSQRTEHSHHSAYSAGADAYVTKPFDPFALAGVIDEICARSPEERQLVREEQQRIAALLDQIEASFGA